MKISVIQLSDIHLSADIDENPILGRVDKIVGAAASACSSSDAHFLVVSGDVANKGKEEEYEIAEPFISSIKSSLEASLGIPSLPLLTIPGNHDCNFDLETSLRRMALNSESMEIDDNTIRVCTEVQQPYWNFVERLDSHELFAPTGVAERLHKAVHFKTNDAHIVFHLLNSAWVSKIHEDAGKMTYPVSVMEVVATTNKVDLAVAVIHHPFNWVSPDNGRALRKCIEEHADIILSGHEHDATAHTKMSDTGMVHQYCEGGALQERSDPATSDFNVLSIDLDRKSVRTHRFSLRDGMYVDVSQPTERIFARGRGVGLHALTFTDDFDVYLDDPGAGFNHPHKANLRLNDLFVPPDLKEVRYDKSANDQKHIRGPEFCDYVLEHRRLVVVGDDKGGKTTLAKVLLRQLKNASHVPLLIDSSALDKCSTTERLHAAIASSIKAQYGAAAENDFFASPLANRAVIIDDFHKIGGNRQLRSFIADEVSKQFGVAVLLV